MSLVSLNASLSSGSVPLSHQLKGNVSVTPKTPAEVVGERVVRPLIDTLYYAATRLMPTPIAPPEVKVSSQIARKFKIKEMLFKGTRFG